MDGEITKAQLFDLLTEKTVAIAKQHIQFNGREIWQITVCDEYPEEMYCYDHPEYKREVFCIFEWSLYIAKGDVIDLLRGKSISIYNNQGIEVLTIRVEE